MIALIIWITIGSNYNTYSMPPIYYNTEVECKTAMSNIMVSKDRPPKVVAFCAQVIQ